MNSNYILIIDYNLSRYDDIKIMTDYAFTQYGLKTILIRPNPSHDDMGIAEHIIDLDPRSKDFVFSAKNLLQPFHGHIHCGLTFSDNAIFSGAKLLEEMGLETDSALLAEAAYSKIKYRQLENEYALLWRSQHMFVPHFKVIYSKEDLLKFANENPHGFVLKPACEGNNRGVMILKKDDNLDEALQTILHYISDGIICEEYIPFADEYSFDGISHLNFITKKLSVKDKYPVEYGQIVSGNIPTKLFELISHAGSIGNLIVGQHSGPFHNEIKVSLDTNQVAVIEPNRRPAGMKIWSLAEKVFQVNFFHLWLDRVISKSIPVRLPIPKGISAIRMLGSPCDGILNFPVEIEKNFNLFSQEVVAIFTRKFKYNFEIEWFGFQFNKKNNSTVVQVPKDNSDFLAQICLFIKDESIDVIPILEKFHACWLEAISDHIYNKFGEIA